MTRSPARYEVVLFDLGGVIIELAGMPIWSSWIGETDEARVWELWLHSTAVRRFESGRSSAAEFGREIVAEFGLSVSPGEFIERFAAWPRGPFPGAVELVARLREQVRVGCLTNCNALHWPRFLDEMGLREAFDHPLSSHLLGVLKPDRQVFEVALRALGITEPGTVLFLDDNQINVDGARAAGLAAEHVRGVDAARATLRTAGFDLP